MKKIFSVAIALLCVYATSFAQSKIPTTITSAFNHKFPSATKVKWDKENAHEYEASFELNGKKLSANYSDKGEWLETESPISFNQLPEKVQNEFNSAHKGAAVKAVAKIETSKNKTKFEIEFRKGLKTIELFYTIDGKKIKE